MKLHSASALLLASALGAAALPPPDCTLRVSSFDDLAAFGTGLALSTELCSAADALSFVEMAKEKAGGFGEFRSGDPIFVFVWGLSSANFKEEDIPADVSVAVGLPVTKPADAMPEFFKEGYSCVGTGDKACYVDEDDLSVQLDDSVVDGFAYRGSYGFFLSTTNLLEADFASLISTPASFAGLPVEFTLRDFGKLMPSSEEMEEELTEAMENCSELAGDANGAFLKSLLKLQLKAAGLAKGLESMRCGMGFDPAKGLVFAEEMKLVPGSEAASFYGTDQVLDPAKIGPAPKNAFLHYATVGATDVQKKWIVDFFREIRPLVEAKISDEALRARVGKLFDIEALVASIGGGEGFLGKDSAGCLAVSSSAKVTDVAAYRAWLGEAVSLVRDLLELPADSTRLRLTDSGFACELEPAAQVSALSTNVPPAVGDVLTVLFGKKWSYEEKIAADGSIHGQGSSTGASLPKDDAFDYARLANEFGNVFPGVPVTMMAGGSYMAAVRDMVTPVFAALRATDPSVPSLDLELPAETGFSFAGSTAQGAVREVMFVSPGEIKGFAALMALGIRTQQQKCMEAIMDFAEDAEDWDPLEDDESEEDDEDESEEAEEE